MQKDTKQEFVQQVVKNYASACSVMMAFLGHKLALFQLLAKAGPITQEDFAKQAGTVPIYTRYWLMNQAAGGYISYDPATQTFFMNDDQRVVLTEEDSSYYQAGMYEEGMALFETTLLRMDKEMKNGHGIPWGSHPPSLFSGNEKFYKYAYQNELISKWLPAALPKDILDRLADKTAKSPLIFADIGCGFGNPDITMAETYPNHKFFGFDLHKESIDTANRKAREKNLSNAQFIVSSAYEVPHPDSVPAIVEALQGEKRRHYDVITIFDALHDMYDPGSIIAHAKKLLKPETGILMLVEPLGHSKFEDNFNPIGEIYSFASVVVCSPNAMCGTNGHKEHPEHVIGTLPPDEVYHEFAKKAGFASFKRVFLGEINRVFILQ